MPLVFDQRQLLPSGVHDATLEEVETYFGRFQRTDRRIMLVQRLKTYVAALQQAQMNGSLILDGSFIMPKVDEPEDLDVILVLPEDWDMTADLLPYQYNLVSKQRVKQTYSADVFTVVKGSSEEHKWVTFFSQVNPKWCQAFGWPAEAAKGLVRIPL